jgi:transposase
MQAIAQVARDLGIHEGTLGNWGKQGSRPTGREKDPSVDGRAQLQQLGRENARLRMEQDVLKRPVVLRVTEATR